MIALLLYAIVLFILTSCAILLPEIIIGLLGNGIAMVEVIFRGVELQHGVMFALTLGCVVFFVWSLRIYKFRIIVTDNIKILSIILGFGVLLWLSLIYTPSPEDGYMKAQFYLLKNVIPFMAFLIISYDTVKLKRVLGLFVIMGIVFFIASAPSIVQGTFLSVSRSSALGRNPIWYARTLGISVISLLFFVKHSSGALKPFLVAAVVSLSVLMVFSGSRGPVFSLFPAIFVFAILSFRSIKLTKSIIQWVLIVGCIYLVYQIVSYFHGAYWSRFLEMANADDFISKQARIEWWKISLQAFIHHPLLGIGAGGYSSLLGVGGLYPHNVLIEVACEFGILGLVLFSSFLVLTIRNIVIFCKESSSNPLYQLAIPFASLFIYAISNSMFSGNIAGNEMIWHSSGVLAGLVTSRKFSFHKLKKKGLYGSSRSYIPQIFAQPLSLQKRSDFN